MAGPRRHESVTQVIRTAFPGLSGPSQRGLQVRDPDPGHDKAPRPERGHHLVPWTPASWSVVHRLVLRRAVAVCVITWLQGCAPASGERIESPEFAARVDLGKVENPSIREASGLAASRGNRNVLWTHNDSGDGNRVYALSTTGQHLGIYVIQDCAAGDWEDIAVGPGPDPGIDYLYVGNIGDNRGARANRTVCRVPEPMVNARQAPVETVLTGAQTLKFRYPDGARDAEALMVDPLSRDLYFVSKREPRVRVYRAAYPQATTGVSVLEAVTTLPLRYVVAGDISATGRELLLKTYTGIYYWRRSQAQTWAAALARPPRAVPYVIEVAGESVCWAADSAGYYTLSEEALGVPARLYFYPRLRWASRNCRAGSVMADRCRVQATRSRTVAPNPDWQPGSRGSGGDPTRA